ncbi:TonB-dependent receptor-like protein [Blastomonas natatoria]|uniref:TonB-dependent receptor-like protein n=1 Tax=Blastomonas natatoria TaxID=34015 RepID=A0A2V3VAB6_9SPHN|nr:TonB-dependent receptor [Blastomonas natatoria]PXW78607.1 TonB-dependent receptor-like protein [Blastomonas natatoria]
MKTYSRFLTGAAPVVMSIALAAMPAMAQEQTTNVDEQEASSEDAPASIVVTGSRIRQPNLEGANPVTVVTGEEFFETGNTSVGDVLNDLPQLRSTFSQQNSTRFLGTRGLNLLDLRGLGSERTLVLVNGRRHVAGDILSSGVSPDINTIPTDLIERVDVLTGGASAVYGSDAVAGVVNFILKDSFDGLQMRGQAGISTYGDFGNQFVSALAGKNFGDGRGNVTLALEYAHTSRAFGSGRPNLRQNNGLVIVDTDPAAAVNGSDGIVDRGFFRDIRSGTISLGGLVASFQNPATSPCGFNVAAFTCTYLFQRDGSLVRQTGTRVGVGPNGSFLGGNGNSNREGELLTLTPDLRRYSANLLAHYEFSPAFDVFMEAKYVRTEAFGSQSGPFFSQGATLGDPGNRERIRLDNPYLSAQARALLTSEFLGSTVNVNTGAALSAAGLAAQRAAINNGSFRFSLRRNWVDFGIRDEEITRETYRIVVGARGEFNDDWNYELSVNYGEHRERNEIIGNVNIQRYLLAVDTARDASGNIVCASRLNPTGTVSYITGTPNGDPRLAGDISACVPLNPFGEGSVTQAVRDYLLVNSLATGKITQLDILGFVSGDTSGFFNLPGGAVAFSAGGEYRRETNFYDLDDLTQEGYAFYNAIPSFQAPALEVAEAFGEIEFPILKDTPFFHNLTVRGNGRVAKYMGAARNTGTVYAYGAEAIWSPIRDITLRGTYSRSVRSPNLGELFSAQGQNFAPGFTDPCSARNLATGSSNRAANCSAAGAPTGYDFVYLQSLEIRSGGNPNLRAETGDSYTVGGIIQPSFIPGLSISADYYDITVKNAIASVSAQQIANLCYDLPSANNAFCGLFTRAGATGGPNGEIPFQILEGSLLQSSANFARNKVRGLDTQFNYNRKLGDWGDLRLGVIWTHYFQIDSFTNPSDPNFANRLIDELGDPSDQVNINANIRFGNVTLGYEMRWLDKMFVNTFEDFNPLNGQPPQNADYGPFEKYPDVFYHDLRLNVDLDKKFNMYVGVDNVTNVQPPFGLTGVGGGSGIYDVRGRYFYAGFQANF